jgi:D-alanyl-D-alanine carboxypeptidase
VTKVMLAVAAALLSSPFLAHAQTAAPPAAAGDGIDRIVAQFMTTKKIPGASIAVIEDGKVIKESSYGVASVELNVPATNDTLYTLASTTKEFTAVAIMTLVEEGKLSLDKSVRDYLPELPANWAPVTVRHCLSHTSGLPDGDAPDNVNVLPLAGTQAELMKLLVTKPVGEPGVKTVYNQTEFMLLGDIIQRISGEPYKAYINDKLLKPLGITSMRWGDAWEVVPNRASLYTALEPTADRSKLQLDDKGEPVLSTSGIHAFGSKVVPEWLTPAAGMNANIEAVSRWEAALWSGKVIKPSTLAMMGAPYKLRDGTAGDFGLSFIPYPVDGQPGVSSGGGAAVWITTLPGSHLTAIVLTNLQDSSPQVLVEQILHAYQHRPR